MDEIRKIEQKLETARAKLLASVQGLDETSWDWEPGDGRWSIRLTLAHVGSAQWSHLEIARRLVAGEPMTLPGFDLDTWNAEQVAQRKEWSSDRVLDDLEAAQEATRVFLEGLDAEKLVIHGPHPALGEVSVGQLLRVIAVHDGMHRRDIVKLLDEMGRTESEL
jgi:uncharacterized damage-inducible protein DinB